MLKRIFITLQLTASCLGCQPANSAFDSCIANAKANWDMAIMRCAAENKGPEACDTDSLMAKRAAEEDACFH